MKRSLTNGSSGVNRPLDQWRRRSGNSPLCDCIVERHRDRCVSRNVGIIYPRDVYRGAAAQSCVADRLRHARDFIFSARVWRFHERESQFQTFHRLRRNFLRLLRDLHRPRAGAERTVWQSCSATRPGKDVKRYFSFNKLAASWSADSLLPPSMRAISSRRALPATSCKFENVRPRTTSLVTTKCDEAAAATGARWVIQIS